MGGLAIALLLGTIISGLASAGASIYSSYNSKKAQEEANQTNIDLQNSVNDTAIANQESVNALQIAEAEKAREFELQTRNNYHQDEVRDLQLAGLNPVLSASGSASGLPGVTANLNTANLNAARVQPASLDFNGIANMLGQLNSTLVTQALINGRIMPVNTARAGYYNTKSNDINNMAHFNQLLAETRGYEAYDKSRYYSALTDLVRSRDDYYWNKNYERKYSKSK